MVYDINRTHDPKLTSWVESANDPGTDFPIQNLPYGVMRKKGSGGAPHIGVAIGDRILDLAIGVDAGLLAGVDPSTLQACLMASLNGLMALDPPRWGSLRRRVSDILRSDFREREKARRCLVPRSEAELLLPASVGDYTDFYASLYHARNVGSMFRPDNPLLPNYKWIPIGYHGRSSSLVVSGTPVRRPWGQTKDEHTDVPGFGACKELDYELEIGFFVGQGNALGKRVQMQNAEQHIFGLCLVNDWSARDIQRWEYQPLGPFLAKSFSTTVSPWVVSLEALAPFRVPAFRRSEGDPAPLPYLSSDEDARRGGVDLTLEVYLSSLQMRQQGVAPVRLCKGNFSNLYWTMAQMLTHHASNGCNLRPGDLLASGTVSGEGKDTRGCLLELTWRGAEPLALPTGEERRFLADSDEVIFAASCQRQGYARIGFGECRGVVEG